jgi:broad specificity phosphatase PhoE
MNKTLYLIRHGLSLHNELYYKIGVGAFKHKSVIDSPLIQDGHIQSIELGNKWENKNKIELVLVSPLMRTLDTCMNIFGSTDINIECYEFLREYPIGEDTCNKRSSLSKIRNKYPKINFHLNNDDDILWTDKRETIEELEIRINEIKEFIKKRKEKHIAIVSHSSLIGKFKDNHIPYIENGDEELKYCYPYEYKL